MKNKGFTLVELLAVIVIIGIIALITIPKIKDSINNSKKHIAEASASNYARTIDQYVLHEESNKNVIDLDGQYSVDEQGNLNGLGNTYELDYTGKKPTSGTLTYQDNKLLSGCLVINGYEVEYQNDKFTSDGKGNCGISPIKIKYFTYDQNAEKNLQYGYITEMKNQIDASWKYYIKTTIEPFEGYTVEENSYYEYDTLEECEQNKSKTFFECISINDKYSEKGFIGRYDTLEECESVISSSNSNKSCKKIDIQLSTNNDFNILYNSEICGVFSNGTVCIEPWKLKGPNKESYIQNKKTEYETAIGKSCITYGNNYIGCVDGENSNFDVQCVIEKTNGVITCSTAHTKCEMSSSGSVSCNAY